jgi:hypothetical protein
MPEAVILRDRVRRETMERVGAAAEEPLIYRSEVLAIIGALADLVVDVGDIRDSVVEDDESEGPEGTE